MTTLNDIKVWFDRGVEAGDKWMVVVCDSFDHEDYPSYFADADKCRDKVKSPGEMQRVMEVYDLRKPFPEVAGRVFDAP